MYFKFISNLVSPKTRRFITTKKAWETMDFYYISLLQQCIAQRSVEEVERVHLQMRNSGFPYLSLGNKLIDAYLKCGSVEGAREIFDEMPLRHIVAWNSLISSYIRTFRCEEALKLYRKMLLEGVIPDEFTFSSLFRAFSDQGLLHEGLKAHGRLIVLGLEARNVFIGSALVNMYAKYGKLRDAKVVLYQIVERDVVSVTALIVGFTQHGEDSEAIRTFEAMVNEGIKANEYTFASVLIACGNLGQLNMGRVIHGLIIRSGFESVIASQTSLLSMYSKCRLVGDALKVFDQILSPNLVTWTAAITCLVQNGREESAIMMFGKMIRKSINPNAYTISMALRACSSLAMFEEGKQIHANISKNGLDRDRFAVAALIDMYGKCGSIEMARLVFDNLLEPDIVSVNTMIYGYAQNGYGHDAIRLFDQVKSFDLEPNDATFISILYACSNAGLLEEGRRIFSLLSSNSENEPTKDHYSCMIDLLGRAGRLREAEILITQVKNPDVVLWRTLLSACKIHGEVEMAKRVAKNVLELDPTDEGTYVLLSNIYASKGNWSEVIKIKTSMRELKLKKGPAMSWVEVNREVHTFMAGDDLNPRLTEIYKELHDLIDKIRYLGYVPDTRFVLQDLDEMEKERSLYYHSEKLAIAFGLLNSRGSHSCIRIFKNLRVCGDCHSWIKLVSKFTGRLIIARDAKRFHHFKDGFCSCGDYW